MWWSCLVTEMMAMTIGVMSGEPALANEFATLVIAGSGRLQPDRVPMPSHTSYRVFVSYTGE